MSSVGPKITLAVLGLFAVVIGSNLLTASPKSELSGPAEWALRLEKEVREIDASTEGNLGVSVKRLGTDEVMSHQGERPWYLASTVKVPVAIAVLQLVEEGRLRLDQELVLKVSDPVDGSGEVQFKKPGTRLPLSYLIEKMLIQSDSTATDLLIRLVGEEELNERIRSKMGVRGFGRFTTILQVRKDAFGYLHPKARELTNRDFIEIKRHRSASAKAKVLSRKMKVPMAEFRERTIDDAFERYYQQGLNSGSLTAFANLLEDLRGGKLLSKPHTELILRHMSRMTTGERRLKAGLPKGIHFAQKTGTQVGRICNVGIATSSTGEAFSVAACLEKFTNYPEAERSLQKVGAALGRSFHKLHGKQASAH